MFRDPSQSEQSQEVLGEWERLSAGRCGSGWEIEGGIWGAIARGFGLVRGVGDREGLTRHGNGQTRAIGAELAVMGCRCIVPLAGIPAGLALAAETNLQV